MYFSCFDIICLLNLKSRCADHTSFSFKPYNVHAVAALFRIFVTSPFPPAGLVCGSLFLPKRLSPFHIVIKEPRHVHFNGSCLILQMFQIFIRCFLNKKALRKEDGLRHMIKPYCPGD